MTKVWGDLVSRTRSEKVTMCLHWGSLCKQEVGQIIKLQGLLAVTYFPQWNLLRAPLPFQHAHQLGTKVSDWRAYGDISYSEAHHLISLWPWFGTRCLFTVHYTCRHTMRQQQTPLGTHCLPSETVLWLWITVLNGLCSLLLSQKHNSSITVNPDVECILPTTR